MFSKIRYVLRKFHPKKGLTYWHSLQGKVWFPVHFQSYQSGGDDTDLTVRAAGAELVELVEFPVPT